MVTNLRRILANIELVHEGWDDCRTHLSNKEQIIYRKRLDSIERHQKFLSNSMRNGEKALPNADLLVALKSYKMQELDQLLFTQRQVNGKFNGKQTGEKGVVSDWAASWRSDPAPVVTKNVVILDDPTHNHILSFEIDDEEFSVEIGINVKQQQSSKPHDPWIDKGTTKILTKDEKFLSLHMYKKECPMDDFELQSLVRNA